MTERDHGKILREFKKDPYAVLDDDKDRAKLMAAIDKSLKLLHKHSSRKAEERW